MKETFTRISYESYLSATQNPWGRLRRPRVYEHASRYYWAAKELQDLDNGMAIIDAASGCGWGTELLAQKTVANRVLGLDIDPAAISKAECDLRTKNARLLFLKQDLRVINFAQLHQYGPFAAIVSFETIEHVTQPEAQKILDNFCCLLEDGGQLLISTPNREFHSPLKGSVFLPDHLHEYTEDEFFTLLERAGFQIEQIFGQRFLTEKSFRRFAQFLSAVSENQTSKKIRQLHPKLNSSPYLLLALFSLLSYHSAEVKPYPNDGRRPLFLIAKCRI